MKTGVKLANVVASFPVKQSQETKQASASKICSKHLFLNQGLKKKTD